MRLSALQAETKSNKQNNSHMNFKGAQASATKNAKFISDKSYAWMESINGVQQRAILGVASIATQPFIDYYNPKADEKTRKYSVLKTIVKIVVGAGVGCAVRAGAIKMAKNMIQKPNNKFLEKIKNPELKKQMGEWFNDKKKKEVFTGNFGTILGIVGVVAADLLIDMPVAKFLIEKSAKKMNLEAPPEGGAHE